MENDLIPFLAGVAILIGYLIFSAATEMGTKLPWKKHVIIDGLRHTSNESGRTPGEWLPNPSYKSDRPD